MITLKTCEQNQRIMKLFPERQKIKSMNIIKIKNICLQNVVNQGIRLGDDQLYDDDNTIHFRKRRYRTNSLNYILIV